MGFIVKYEDLEQVGNYLDKKLPEWDNNFQDIENKFKIVAESDAFKGASADSVKDYIEDFHQVVLASFSQLVLLMRAKYLMYKDGYYSQIDNQRNTYIVEDRLEAVKNKYGNRLQWLYSDKDAINSALAEVSDIFDRGRLNIAEAEDAYTQMMKNADKLRDDINRYENDHYSNDYKEIEDIMNNLRTLINSQKGASRIDISAYTKYDMVKFEGFKDLINSLQVSSQNLGAQQVDLENALARENHRQYIKRQEEAEKIRVINTIVTAVVCVVVAPLPGGFIIGTCVCLLSGTIDQATDQYAEVGWGKINWGEALWKGTLTGIVAAAVGKGMGALSESLLKTATPFIKSAAGKAVYVSSINAGSGIAERGITGVVDSPFTHASGGEVIKNMFDPWKIGIDMAGGHAKTNIPETSKATRKAIDVTKGAAKKHIDSFHAPDDKQEVDIYEADRKRAAEIHNKVENTKVFVDEEINKKDINQFNIEGNQEKVEINSSGAEQDINQYNIDKAGKVGVNESYSKQDINQFGIDMEERKVEVNKSDLHQDINSYNVDRETREVEINKTDIFGQKINQYNTDNGERKVAVNPFGKVFFANISNQKNVVTPKIFNPQAKAREALNRLYADINSKKIEINKASIDWRDRVKVGI